MSDDLDALLARADRNADRPGGLIRDLAAAVRTLRTDYDTALDVISRRRDGWRVGQRGTALAWRRGSPPEWEDVTDAERAVLAAAETRHKDLP